MSKRFAVLLVVIAFVAGLLANDLFHSSVVAQEAKDAKAPKWQHGLMMRARKGDEADFTKDTKRYGVEVFEDVNNGNIIYISETGSIAVVKK
jgi:hypothetical protein